MTNPTENTYIDNEYKIYSGEELLNMPLQKTEFLMKPAIQEKGVTLVYAERGTGKTYYCLAMALALASGIDFIDNKCSKPVKVLYVDGEMDSYEMAHRLELLKHGFEREGKKVILENINMFLVDCQNDAQMPILSRKSDQEILNGLIEKYSAQVIFIDNIVTLYCPNDENDASSWQKYNDFSKDQRNKGRSLVWIHHTGKVADRGPRGSASIETLLNTSIFLRKPENHKAEDGALIEVEYTKSRSIAGDDIKTRTLRLEIVELDNVAGISYAQWKKIPSKKDEVLQYRENGDTIETIATKTKLSKSAVGRIVKGQKRNKK